MDYAKLTYANLDICTVEKQYINIYIYMYMHILDTTYWYLDLVSITYFVYIVHTVHVYIYMYIYMHIYMYIYMHIYMYTQTLDIQRVLLSIFNIPHILCKIYSTNIFTYIVYITSTVDTVHVAYTIYIAAEKTPPPLPQGGEPSGWGGRGCGGPCSYIYI